MLKSRCQTWSQYFSAAAAASIAAAVAVFVKSSGVFANFLEGL